MADELGIQSIALAPLRVDDIDKFLNMTFPGIDMPNRLTRELADLAQGNPAFYHGNIKKNDQRSENYSIRPAVENGPLGKKIFPQILGRNI